ncbi:glycoside hydrolase family 3 N-terminal domain-containing protein [Mycobacterium sp. E787]|uniref:glycoside hydrolase family 3 N-terminal domain-containing protein n=1 Tax=Mycobacterium sp. E787 TaxID=1834150 RepID=UPI0008013022|nr:glycoside hydrolase family 3 N-terminal domain-containing protein [Mycobacterium sp. E787]OBI51451.1 beta-glucosidase [Mycobacterium sp. E787]
MEDTDRTARSRRSWPRTAVIAAGVLAVALVVGGVIVGVRLAGSRHSASSPTSATAPHGAPASPKPPGCDITSLLASMSNRDKLAQLLMVGVTDADDARAVVANHHVGGIFVASWTNLSMLTDGSLAEIARSAGPLHLAVSVDEEGGRVERLSSLIGQAPSARLLARSEPADQVYQLALDRGRKMRQLGITIDFAPVVDVTDAPDQTVIGDRSFSDDPAVVTRYASAYARGLRDAGVLPVLKHFPGHGRASGDSHATGVVTPPLDEMQGADLVPYRTLVAQVPVGVMIGHMQVPGLTGSDPASLSPAAIALLRNGIGYGAPPFDGPVFTDDLGSMRAITDRYGVAEAVLKALQAGNDTALWVSTTAVPAVLDRLVSALNDGELSLPSIEASVRRMAAAKAFNSPCGH